MRKNKIKDFLKFHNIDYKEDCSLKPYTTSHLGGCASFIVVPNSQDKIVELYKFIHLNKINYFILGNGSKIVFSDLKFKGIIISLLSLNKITIENNIITAQSGALLSRIFEEAKQNNLQGINELTGIPATIGGALFMNAGCYGKEIGELVIDCLISDEFGNLKRLKNEEMKIGYRKSIFQKRKWIIIEVTLLFENASKEEIIKATNFYLKKRLQSQPLLKNTFGSTFKNPGVLQAWKLIAPLKEEIDENNIKISRKHANFLEFDRTIFSINLVNFIVKIKQKVYNNYRINLPLEVILVNFKAKDYRKVAKMKKKK